MARAELDKTSGANTILVLADGGEIVYAHYEGWNALELATSKATWLNNHR